MFNDLAPADYPSPTTLLEHLVDVLAHPNSDSRAFLGALGHQASDSTGRITDIGDVARCGERAGLSYTIVTKIIIAKARAGGLGWSPDKVRSVVGSIYQASRTEREAKARTTVELPQPEAT